MNYYLNEYSLRGQFKDIEDFFLSLREYTFPVLNKIQKNKENIIWKKDIFWQCEVCRNFSLADLVHRSPGRKEYSPESAALKIKLIKLMSEEPFWRNDEDSKTEIMEYQFDKEYNKNFDAANCFYKAVQNEGRIVSFLHEQYTGSKLWVVVRSGQAAIDLYLDNVYTIAWWDKEPEIKTWRLGQKYLVEVRANEFSFHPPHFHVTHNEFSAVFRLSDGNLYREGGAKWSPQMIKEVLEWYNIHKEDLLEAWESLHGISSAAGGKDW